ncbi:MAG: dGTP triphosphohydrolase [Acidimicrobiales bacterium]|nr:dGTP triphosphohydrolase [Acidimicrobiales bacterium]
MTAQLLTEEFFFAHDDSQAVVGNSLATREEREAALDGALAPGATRAHGAGDRARAEGPDPFRLCFERDLDRIKHSTAFRRLAGKCQVFIAPADDHLRTRLTHAIEVAQVAVAVARSARLNVALTEAIALGHDCGHGPAGHASETAFSAFLPGGYDHAVYGADVTVARLNLCVETLDGIRNHSWRRPAPATPEGEVVSWADRIAYVCHDFEDAVRAGIVSPADLPDEVGRVIGTRRSQQLNTLVVALLQAIASTGRVGMAKTPADALAAFRQFNYERIYLRPASCQQADRVIALLRQLVECFADAPGRIPSVEAGEHGPVTPGSGSAFALAVNHVSGMTDRYALALAVDLLGWHPDRLPRGV